MITHSHGGATVACRQHAETVQTAEHFYFLTMTDDTDIEALVAKIIEASLL